MFGLRLGAMGRVGAGLTLTQQAINILRRPGLESHVYMPGVGWVNGLSLTNTIMEDGTQAASVDNPLGYMGDAASTTLGAELVTNGDFSDGTAGWSSASTAPSSWSVSGGQLVMTADGANRARARQTVTTVVGKSYQVSVQLTNAELVLGTSAGGTQYANVAQTTNAVSLVFTATTTSLFVQLSSLFNGTGYADNISVRELVGAIPARQATTANKPILRRGHVNRIRNSTMVGAVAGTPGTLPTNWNGGLPTGISRTVVGVGTVDGLSYIDVRFFGTASATGGIVFDPEATYSNVPALNGQTWTFGASLALVGGSWPVRAYGLEVIERNSSNGFLTSSFLDVRPLVTGAALTRVPLTRTLNNAATAGLTCGFRCGLTSGDVIDFTVRIAAPQLEQGSVANTFVPTTTATASSPTGPFWAEFDGTDFLSLAAVPFQMSDDHYVVMAAQSVGTGTNTLFSVRSTASANPIIASVRFDWGTNQIRAAWRNDAGTLVFADAPVVPAKGTTYVIEAWKSGDAKRLSVNGVAGSPENTVMGATTVNSAALGCDPTAAPASLLAGGLFNAIVIKDTLGILTSSDCAILRRYVAQASGVTL